MKIEVSSPEEQEIRQELARKADPASKRLLRMLAMPDLSRRGGNPLEAIVSRILAIPRFSDFDVITVPEIVRTDISFDLFNFPPDHPARSTSDTYHINEHLLRTHTTIMWYYYLKEPAIQDKIQKRESLGALCYGKVYRKDEIDRRHMNVFHQMDGWYLTPKNVKTITQQDLEEVLVEIAKTIYGKDIEYRFNKDEFPYTDPSIEMEIKIGDHWVEVLGSGIVRANVLQNLGVNPDEYNGWAFGFGLDRLAIVSMDLPDIRLLWSDDPRVQKQMQLGKRYEEVSKYPPVIRDISFIVDKSFAPNNYFDLIRDIGGNLVEEVALIDKYADAAKFGTDKISYTYRITYRSTERTLVHEEIDKVQGELYKQTAEQFSAQLR